MRISDWSSDVCSSDLPDNFFLHRWIQKCLDRCVHAFRRIFSDDHQLDVSRHITRQPHPNGVDPHSADRLGQQYATTVQVFAENLPSLLGDVSICDRPVQSSLLSDRSEEHTSELQYLMRISYAVFCLKK